MRTAVAPAPCMHGYGAPTSSSRYIDDISEGLDEHIGLNGCRFRRTNTFTYAGTGEVHRLHDDHRENRYRADPQNGRAGVGRERFRHVAPIAERRLARPRPTASVNWGSGERVD